jgi:hypothetical protein
VDIKASFVNAIKLQNKENLFILFFPKIAGQTNGKNGSLPTNQVVPRATGVPCMSFWGAVKFCLFVYVYCFMGHRYKGKIGCRQIFFVP